MLYDALTAILRDKSCATVAFASRDMEPTRISSFTISKTLAPNCTSDLCLGKPTRPRNRESVTSMATISTIPRVGPN